MRLALLISLLVLVLPGCKKKNTPETTATSQPAAPSGPPGADQVRWRVRGATFQGTRTSSKPGTLTVPVRIKNESANGLLVDKIRIGVLGRDGAEACNGVTTELHKVGAGAVVDVELELPCLYMDLGGDELNGLITTSFRMGGQTGTLKEKRTFPFIR